MKNNIDINGKKIIIYQYIKKLFHIINISYKKKIFLIIEIFKLKSYIL